ncbi:hypothetical protein [Paraburkholderia caffeinilytica]|uniref:hypothetical protein n=1 Tax=Paraburkholderia caffeinilytica TaxID=1761016 RepID=UPI003DA11CE8
MNSHADRCAPPIVHELAPMIALGLSGPFAGSAIAILEQALNLDPVGANNVQVRLHNIWHATESATLEQLLALTEAEHKYCAQMAKIGFADAKALAAACNKLKPRRNSRPGQRGRRDAPLIIGIISLVCFGGTIAAALAGAYGLMVGGVSIRDTAVAEIVSGLGGTILGYTSANAQQVLSFYFNARPGQTKPAPEE